MKMRIELFTYVDVDSRDQAYEICQKAFELAGARMRAATGGQVMIRATESKENPNGKVSKEASHH